MRFSIFQESRQGTRRGNEDRTGYCYSRNALLMVVADGMGGHEHGEIASNIAVQFLADAFRSKATPSLRDPQGFLQKEMSLAHHAIIAYAKARGLPETPRTTCVACIVQDGLAHWAHVGDSRLYHLRAGRIESRTHDHSRVQQLVDAGRIREEAVQAHPERNKIFNCLGSSTPPKIEISKPTMLQYRDMLLLCSDGLWGPLPASMIAQCAAGDLLKAVPALLDAAQVRSGKTCDNLSVVAMVWAEETRPHEEHQISTHQMDDTTVNRRIEVNSVKSTVGLNDPAAEFMSDEEIERAITEIRNAIRRSSGQ